MAKKLKQIYLSRLTKRYKVVKDECWKLETPEVRKPDARWYEQIRLTGKCDSFISLYSEDPPIISIFLDNRPGVVQKLLDGVKGITLFSESYKETELHFSPEVLEQVCEIAGARKKKQLSEEQKHVCATRLATYKQGVKTSRTDAGRALI